jgi:hypothetical protein
MRLKIFFACLFSMAILASSANATIILHLVVDPATDADNGIAPTVPGNHVVTSTQTGAGRYHLYAMDNTAGSLGISSYNITVNNSATNLHRSSVTTWNDADENGPFAAGFNLLRSPNNNGGIFQASQPLPGTVPVLIAGYGREASNFSAKIPQSTSFAVETSGQWGNYATDPAVGGPWFLIGEGTYTAGQVPSIGSAAVITYFNDQFASFAGEVCIGAEQCLGPGGNPPDVNPLTFNNVNASDPGSVSGTVTQTGGDPPITWGPMTFVDFVASHGALDATGDAEAANATFDAGTQLFSWNTVGAPRGTYTWSVQASNTAGTNSDLVTVVITEVPEPATIALFGIAMVGGLGLVRRRNG